MPFDIKSLNGFCCQYEGHRQHFPGFIGSISKHHTLIASALLIHTESDVTGLLGNLRFQLEALIQFRLGKQKDIPHETADIRFMLGCDFSGHIHMVVLNHGLNRHTAVAVVLQTVGHDGVADLVANLVGMPGGHLFAGKKHVLQLLVRIQEKPRRVCPREALSILFC